jgi:hypothetical protein
LTGTVKVLVMSDTVTLRQNEYGYITFFKHGNRNHHT